MILPGTGRGTMPFGWPAGRPLRVNRANWRSMVEGHRRFTGRREGRICCTRPSTVLRTVPLPVPGRN